MPRIQFQTLTEPMYYILLILQEPHYGYEIMQEAAALTQNRVQIGAGTLYALLARFEDEGMIRQTAVADRKKIYCLTGHGHHILMTEYKRLVSMVEDGRSRLKPMTSISNDGRFYDERSWK